MNETMKNLSTTINKALSDTVETVVKNVIKHCSGEEFSSTSQLVHYILTHPEYELNSIHTTPPNSTTVYKVSYKGEEMACCIFSYHIDLCNPGQIKFGVDTTYSYEKK